MTTREEVLAQLEQAQELDHRICDIAERCRKVNLETTDMEKAFTQRGDPGCDQWTYGRRDLANARYYHYVYSILTQQLKICYWEEDMGARWRCVPLSYLWDDSELVGFEKTVQEIIDAKEAKREADERALLEKLKIKYEGSK